jgi:uncharacterized protein YoxC
MKTTKQKPLPNTKSEHRMDAIVDALEHHGKNLCEHTQRMDKHSAAITEHANRLNIHIAAISDLGSQRHDLKDEMKKLTAKVEKNEQDQTVRNRSLFEQCRVNEVELRKHIHINNPIKDHIDSIPVHPIKHVKNISVSCKHCHRQMIHIQNPTASRIEIFVKPCQCGRG